MGEQHTIDATNLPVVIPIADIFAALPERFKAASAKGMHAVYAFELTGAEPCSYQLSVDNGTLEISSEFTKPAGIKIGMDSTVFHELMKGEISPAGALNSGKLTIEGEPTLAAMLPTLFPTTSE